MKLLAYIRYYLVYSFHDLALDKLSFVLKKILVFNQNATIFLIDLRQEKRHCFVRARDNKPNIADSDIEFDINQ